MKNKPSSSERWRVQVFKEATCPDISTRFHMKVIPLTLKPTMEEIFEEEPLSTTPLPFDGLILMQIGLDEEAEEEVDIRNLRSFLEKDDEEDEEEEEERVWVRAKRSISQDLA